MKRKVNVNKEFYNPEMYNRFIIEKCPSVSVSGEFDVTRLYKFRKIYSFNAMVCYAIQESAQGIKAYHYSIKENGLYYYDYVKTRAVVEGKDGKLYYADYAYHKNFHDFFEEYTKINKYCYEESKSFIEDTGALLATSAVINFPFQSFSMELSDTFWDNFLIWGKFIKKGLRVKLNISFRFHHATIDGQRAGLLFAELQNQINKFNPNKK